METTENVTTEDTTDMLAQPEEREALEQVEASAETEVEAGTETDTETPVEETWEPNYKFKIKDDEYEFDEWARPLVQNKEVEEKFRDVFTKARGIDEIKASRDALKEELSTVKPEYERINGLFETFNKMVESKDYRQFFNALKIPKEDILRYAVEELKYQEMPAEEKARIDAERATRERLAALEAQNQQLQTTYQEQVRSQVQNDLNQQLNRPDLVDLIATYDARVGKPGAFRQEIINRGALYESTYGETRTAQQLVEEVVQLIGGTPQPQASTVATQPGTGQTPVVKPKHKEALPNMQGAGSSSPTGKTFTSVEQLREKYKQMTN